MYKCVSIQKRILDKRKHRRELIAAGKCGDYLDKNGYVAKILKEKLNDGYKEIYKILRKEDPNEDRFALYHVIQRNKCTIPSIDITNCENVLFSPLDTETVLVTKKLVDIPDITKLTAQQYRYLRESLKILRKLQNA